MKKLISERPWLLALLIVFIVAFPGFLRVEYINNKTDKTVQCINDWADKTVNRSTVLTKKNQERSDALDTLIRFAIAQDREAVKSNTDIYVRVSDEYKKLVDNNPIPESPKLSCN